MIVGIGVDAVDVERFRRALERTPRLADRLFTTRERVLPVQSLAARFAAKEAFIKAMGDSGKMSWHEMEIVQSDRRAPRFELTGNAAELAATRGASSVHLSLTHDGGQALAFVVAEGNIS